MRGVNGANFFSYVAVFKHLGVRGKIFSPYLYVRELLSCAHSLVLVKPYTSATSVPRCKLA